ncbi:MAG TPA: hypothetical protein VM737_11240 [Gemmatimonadota bacterium]|nr:hypothetical protein [Gemmatimonadota bacterium]
MRRLFTAVTAVAGIIALACAQDSPLSLRETLQFAAGEHGEHGLPAGRRLTLAQAPDYATLDDAGASGNPGGALKLSVDAAGAIPRFPDAFIEENPVFGYAWADLDTGAGIVAVIHPAIGRDSRQNPDGWHTHPVVLSGGENFDFCVESIGGSQAGIAIRATVLEVNMAARQAGLSAADLDVAAAFVVQGDGDCVTTELGVEVLDAVPL